MLTDSVEQMCGSIVAELSLKLGEMWDNQPYSYLGFYGESQGYSSEEVNRFMSSVLDEYDRIVDKTQVHNLISEYMGPSSDIVASFRLKVQSGLPLQNFRNAFHAVRGHATSLVVSRRNEGDHRNMNLNLRTTPNASGPLMMARLRSPQVETLLKQSGFVVFAGKAWPRRGKHSAPHAVPRRSAPRVES